MSRALRRHATAAAAVAAVVSVLVVDAARRESDASSRPWLAVVLALLVCYHAGVLAYCHRRMATAQGQAADAIAAVGIVVAWGPTLWAVFTGLLGAPAWAMWAGAGVTWALLAWWVTWARA